MKPVTALRGDEYKNWLKDWQYFHIVIRTETRKEKILNLYKKKQNYEKNDRTNKE